MDPLERRLLMARKRQTSPDEFPDKLIMTGICVLGAVGFLWCCSRPRKALRLGGRLLRLSWPYFARKVARDVMTD